MPCKRIVIAGTGSGVGKTSVALGLVRSLARRGLRVQPFKVGPDFLDPTYLSRAAGRTCYNLDPWMMGRDYVRDLFARATADADVAVVEGVMGMYDGASADTSEGSTADVAQLLDAPVALVVDARGAARSLAATVKGFDQFEAEPSVAAVIANRSGSHRHPDWVRDALVSAGLPPLVGAVPRDAFPALRSRHLGLVTADAQSVSNDVLDRLADACETHVDLDTLLELAAAERAGRPTQVGHGQAELDRGALDLEVSSNLTTRGATFEPRGSGVPNDSTPRSVAEAAPFPIRREVRIGIARDSAFHFYYPDTLEALERRGTRLVPFSPLADPGLPDGLDALFLGGGYPEEHAETLSANAPMRAAIRDFAASGRPIYAECGGLMYLGAALETTDGQRHAMAGVLPFTTRMLPRRRSLGYTEITLTTDSLWGRQGDVLRGHEFHYSEVVDPPDDTWSRAYSVQRRRDPEAVAEGFQSGRVLASYVHLHLASRPGAVDHFLQLCEGSP